MSKDVMYRRLVGSKRWAYMARALKTRANWVCSVCGRVTHRMAVHHIVPIETGRDLREMERLCFDPANCQVVCFQCHSDIHQSQRRKDKQLARERQAQRLERFFERVTMAGESGRQRLRGACFFNEAPHLRKSTVQHREVIEEVSEPRFSPSDDGDQMAKTGFGEGSAPHLSGSPTTTGIGDTLEPGAVFDGEEGLIIGVDMDKKNDDGGTFVATVESDGTVSGYERVSGERLLEIMENYVKRHAEEEHD